MDALDEAALPPSTNDLLRRSTRWRIALAVVTVVLGLAGFSGGVSVTERPSVVDEGFLTHLYYTLGLFIFGGMDLGTPQGGLPACRAMLWMAYFVAPAVTASAVLSAAYQVLGGDTLRQRRLKNHIVLVGCGRMSRLYLRKLRRVDPRRSVLVLGAPGEAVHLAELKERFRVHVIEGQGTSRVILRRLRLNHAARVLVLTNDDFTNFDIATRMLDGYPRVAPKLHVHAHDLIFVRSIQGTGHPVLKTVFNGHERAAKHLVEKQLIHHFQQTANKDTVVLAGFGNFGQTVLHELQEKAVGQLERVVIVDTEAKRHAATFREQVGFQDHYHLDVIDGDIRFPKVWGEVDQYIDLSEAQPVVLIGSGDDRANIRVALGLAERYPNVMVIARNEVQWWFADSLSRVANIEIVNVIQLVTQSMPDQWFGDRPVFVRDQA